MCLVVCADHLLPFQCSARVRPEVRSPTAMQSLAHVQEMWYGSPCTTGVESGWMLQVRPFQPSPSNWTVFAL